MKNTVRVSFDVPIDEHTFLKTECTKSRIYVRDLLRQFFHEKVEELRKNKLHEKLKKGIENSYKKSERVITKDYLNQIENELDNLDV